MKKPVCAVKTTCSFDPEPFIKNGSFVRIRKGSKEKGVYKWGMIIEDRIIYQNEGWDRLRDVLPNENEENFYVVDRVYECKFGFDSLKNCTPVWVFKEKKGMPELKTGMFIAVDNGCGDEVSWGIVANDLVVYQEGGFDPINIWDMEGCNNFSSVLVVVEGCTSFQDARNVAVDSDFPSSGKVIWRNR